MSYEFLNVNEIRVDIVLLIDGTGSMNLCMDALKSSINIFLNRLTGEQSVFRDWRGKVVTYRDHKVGEPLWFEDNPFVQNDAPALKAQLDTLQAWGGGTEEPESLLDALHKISSMGQTDEAAQELAPYLWRYRSDAGRVVIVFTDATYHTIMSYPDGSGGGVDDVSVAILSNEIILMLFAPDHDCYDKLDSIDKCQWTSIPEVDDSFAKGLEEYTRDSEEFSKAVIESVKGAFMSPEMPAPFL